MPPLYSGAPFTGTEQWNNVISDVSWIVFGIMVVLCAVFSVILNYHWKRFNFTNSTKVGIARGVYYGGVLLLGCVMIISLLAL